MSGELIIMCIQFENLGREEHGNLENTKRKMDE
jgi:hypothetical protein